MKRRVLIGLIVVFIPLLSGLYADAGDVPVTPYGGYCRECTNYGSCRAQVNRREAVQALKRYYEERGYRIGTLNYNGRFIEAEVLLDKKPVDKVIFDRKTGRIRSIF